jgi:hypothetical protein
MQRRLHDPRKAADTDWIYAGMKSRKRTNYLIKILRIGFSATMIQWRTNYVWHSIIGDLCVMVTPMSLGYLVNKANRPPPPKPTDANSKSLFITGVDSDVTEHDLR